MKILPEGAPEPIQVYCMMRWGGRTYLMKRNDGSVSFNRPWADYKEGFGGLDGEHWLGLENMHHLTKTQRHRLVIEVQLMENGYNYRLVFIFITLLIAFFTQ